MPSITTDTFLTALTKSNLLSAEQLTEARTEATAIGTGADVKTVARGLIKQGFLTRWQAEQLLAGRANLFLGKYKLLERIGKGGMGTVFKAEHVVMSRTVALKVMSPSLLSNTNAVARFHREVQAAAALQHPNIVSAYDADCVGQRHFLVMEYVEGHDLKERLQQQGRLSVGWVCECIRQAALGLQHAHEHGMVHRDIKPANLLATTDKPDGPPVVKILDMGLARFVSNTKEDGGLTKSGQIMGTPDYIAPEQAEDTKHADIRADIFSLGCTLFHLLTGRTPYQGETLMAKLMARMQDTVPPASSLRSDVPPALDTVIAKMLETKPADRQQTPAEVATALVPFAAAIDAAFDETISVTDMAVQTPTVGVNSSPSPTDTGMNVFLDGLANVPDHRKQRVGRRTRKRRRRPEPEKAEASSEESETSEQTDQETTAKILPRILIGAACAAIVVLAGLAALVLTRDATPVAEVQPVEPVAAKPESEPESGLERFLDESADTASRPGSTEPSNDAATAEPDPNAASKEVEPEDKASTPSAPTLADELENKVADRAPMEPAEVAAAEVAHAPRTLVVGIGQGELPDLNTAFEQAGPGDTILIRHRGPLEFNPVDLNGKTPLTIVGDTDSDGTDFWPIVRQIPWNPDDKTQVSKAAGLFYGDQLDLTFRKLHLAVGGPQRAHVDSVFSFHAGRVELDQCTVTVGVAGNPGEPPGQPMRFVHVAPPSTDRVASGDESASLSDALEPASDDRTSPEVILNRTFLRGLRLQSCVDAESERQIKLTATHTVWAGGRSPWLVVNDHGGGLKVALTNCTIYNAASLLQWKSYDNVTTRKPFVEFEAQKSLFVGPYANNRSLVVWNEGDPKSGFDRAVAEGMVRWQGSENVFHRYPSYFQTANARKQPELNDWRTLWKQSGPSMAEASDPMFRVWPEGEELQETTAHDFQSRFWKKRRGTRIDDDRVGAQHEQMPYAFMNIFGRPLPKGDTAGTPRGAVRVLQVHQKDGPYKTLEAAFADARDEDIIEITDDGPYTPRRNFDTAPADGVLITPAGHLTLRARDGTTPVVVLRDDVQRGQMPKPHRAESQALVLLTTSIASTSLTVEGIHFRSAVLRPMRRTVLCCPQGLVVRVSDCTFLDVGRPLGKPAGGHLGPDPANSALFLLTDSQRLIWLENIMFFPAERDACWSLFSYARFPRSGIIRNCGCEGTMAKFSNGRTLNLTLSSCTLIGSITGLNYPTAMRANDSFIYSSTTLFPPEVAGALGNIRVEGANNCLWIGERRMTEFERSSGVAGLIRGPLITSVPRTEGAATAKDPHRRYRLKKGQPAAKMAADGGPVGLRFEYLPDLSALPAAFFQGL